MISFRKIHERSKTKRVSTRKLYSSLWQRSFRGQEWATALAIPFCGMHREFYFKRYAETISIWIWTGLLRSANGRHAVGGGAAFACASNRSSRPTHTSRALYPHPRVRVDEFVPDLSERVKYCRVRQLATGTHCMYMTNMHSTSLQGTPSKSSTNRILNPQWLPLPYIFANLSGRCISHCLIEIWSGCVARTGAS